VGAVKKRLSPRPTAPGMPAIIGKCHASHDAHLLFAHSCSNARTLSSLFQNFISYSDVLTFISDRSCDVHAHSLEHDFDAEKRKRHFLYVLCPPCMPQKSST
jgi:hypothetical protein